MSNVHSLPQRQPPAPPAGPGLRMTGAMYPSNSMAVIATYHLEERLERHGNDDWMPWTMIVVRDRCLATMRASETTDIDIPALVASASNDRT